MQIDYTPGKFSCYRFRYRSLHMILVFSSICELICVVGGSTPAHFLLYSCFYSFLFRVICASSLFCCQIFAEPHCLFIHFHLCMCVYVYLVVRAQEKKINTQMKRKKRRKNIHQKLVHEFNIRKTVVNVRLA